MSLSNLTVRILTGIAGVPLLLVCTFAGGWVFFVLVTLIALFSLRELSRFYTSDRSLIPVRVVGSLGIAALMFDGWMWAGAHWGLLLLAGTGLILLTEIFRNDPRPEAVIGGTVVSWLYLAIPLSHFMWLRGAEGIIGHVGGGGAWLVLALWLIVWLSDTAAFMVGRTWGRKKIIPAVSPNKTWEGTIAGFISAGLAGMAFSWVLPSLGWTVSYAVIVGLVIGIAAFLGDLVESRLKRGAGIKDSGTTLPGHGGILDRFDSIIFCVPVLYYILML